mmetsp:Transcript_21804/g.61936  ORF Transcript_21804/g.61936 Transcript_21804/m.61936 type:complete len:216 (-) Transcript_21804:170-817(-)
MLSRGVKSRVFTTSSFARRSAIAGGAAAVTGTQGHTSNAALTRLGALDAKLDRSCTPFCASEMVGPNRALIPDKASKGSLIGLTSRLCSTGSRSMLAIACGPPFKSLAIVVNLLGSSTSSWTSLEMTGIVEVTAPFISASSCETFAARSRSEPPSAEASSFSAVSLDATRPPYQAAQKERQPPPTGATLAGSAKAFSSASWNSPRALTTLPTTSA